MEGMGQKPIVLKRFVSGYVANRIQSAISAEVFRLLDEEVASPREIDDAIIHGLSLRIPILGHLAKADFTGLELVRNALANNELHLLFQPLLDLASDCVVGCEALLRWDHPVRG